MYPGGSARSQHDVPADGLIARLRPETVVQPDLVQRVPLKERPIRVAELSPMTSKAFERLAGNHDGHGPTPARQFDFASGLGLVHYGRKTRSGLGN